MNHRYRSIIFTLLFSSLLVLAGIGLVLVIGWNTGTLDFSFLKNKSNGMLAVNVRPDGSQVYIDGQLKGQTPFLTQLKIGNHKVRVEGENAQPYDAIIQIKANEITTLTHQLFIQPTLIQINDNASYPFWSSGGELLYFKINTGEILSNPPGKLRGGPFLGEVNYITYSPKGPDAVVNLLQSDIPDLLQVNLAGNQTQILGSGSCPTTWTQTGEIISLCGGLTDLNASNQDLRLWKGMPGKPLQTQGNTDFSITRPPSDIKISGDSNWLSIISGMQLTLWQVGAQGAVYAYTIDGVQTATWSPGESPKLAYLDSSGTLWLMMPGAGAKPVVLASPASPPLTWMSDSVHVLYPVYSPTEGGSTLWSVNITDQTREILADANIMRGRVAELAISPDNHSVAYSTDYNILFEVTIQP